MVMSSLALGALLVCTGGTALAQRFQYEYGGGNPEAGRGGVRPLRDGGYIAVGETFSTSSGTSDIYLVRTNNDGSLAWSRNYDLGGNDSATDIEEVRLDDQGGFIITGVTENPWGCERMRDAFLLRIDPCGKVIWVDTYGTKETDEIGWDVIEMQNPAPNCDGWQGDFVVAGSTAFPGAPLEAYLFRVHNQPPGNLVWTRTYNGPCDEGDDYFYGVTEAVTGVDGNPGDIIAVGGSNSYSNCGEGFGGIDALIVRVDGCGKINNAPEGVAIYGGRYDDDLRSVIEVANNCPGNIIATGRTEIDPAGVVAPEVYVVETNADPCNKVTDLRLGDGKDQWDEGYDLHEVPADHPDAGYIVVTGYMTLPGGFGGPDVFIQRLKPCGLGLVGPVTYLYGGGGTDWGWSVAPVVEELPCFSAGYVIAGFTDSFSDQQLYLIKTDINLSSACNETEAEAHSEQDVYEWKCVETRIEERGEECEPKFAIECPDWQTELCYKADETEICFAPECECPHGLLKNNLSGNALIGAGALNIYPNPIKRGSLLSLECTLVNEGRATIVVSDLMGKMIYTHSGNLPAGVSHLPVKTDGWSIGAYMVTVTAGGASQTSRIVVTDK